MRPAGIIAAKRDREILSDAQIQAFVRGLVDESWSEGQVAALAMAILLNGMSRAETACLTRAMTHSGPVLDWADADFSGPVLDKHSTGGVGDKVSLLLAPIVAACGGVVPMISGRGLAHTGGTLDKLESIPGYTVAASRDQCLSVLKTA
ncbi:MAG: thymidine phosphorylase, partial [Betaproteobacteria bacterium]|nr:thymidine phosphorylase [Betaproteobacteria bacterium]